MDIALHLDRSQQAKVEAEARADSTKTAKQIISDTDNAEKEKVKKTKESAAARAKEEKELQAEINKAKKEAVAEFDKVMRQSDAEARKITAERLRAERAATQEVIRLQKQKAAEAKRFLEQEAEAQKRANAATMQGVQSLVQMSASFVGLQSASSFFHGVVSELDKSAAYGQKLAQDLLKVEGSLRELAALRGDLGKTGPTTAHVIGAIAQTLQSPEDFKKTEQSFMGVAQLAIGKSLKDQAQADELAISAGKFQAIEGGSGTAHGELMGNIAMQSQKRMSTPEIEARAMQVHNLIQPGAFETDTQGIEQVNKLNGYVRNGTITQAQAAMLASEMSLYSKQEAGTYSQAFLDATLTAQIKSRGIHLAEGVDGQKTDEYLASLGVKNEKDPFKIGDLIAADIAKHKNDPGFIDAKTYLVEHGYGNKIQAEALQNYASGKNEGAFEPLEKIQKEPLAFSPLQGPISWQHEQSVATEGVWQDMKVKRDIEISNFNTAQKNKPYELAREAAFSRMLKENPAMGDYENWKPKSAIGEFGSDLISGISGTGTYRELGDATHKSLVTEAKRLNLNVPDLAMFGSPLEQDKELARQISTKGGDVTAAVAMKDLAKGAKDFADVMAAAKKAIIPVIPAPVQGKPNQPVLRP